MAKPRSDERRSAIMAAATRVIAVEGLGAATAAIAAEAGISNGSLFTYFETKADLLNALYVEIKSEMAAAAMEKLPVERNVRDQLFHLWRRSLRWAVAAPEKRRALAHLSVCDEISARSRQAGHQAMAGIAALLEQGRKNGPLRKAPLPFVVALINAVGDTAMDFMISDPDEAEKHCTIACEAMWRILA